MEFACVPYICSVLAFGLFLSVSLGCCEEGEEITLHPAAGACGPVRLQLCQGLPYNRTETSRAEQEAAELEVKEFRPLVEVGCSPDLQLFLCSVYAPECVNGRTKPPCRATCEAARLGCERLMNKLSFFWPSKLDCASFSYEACEDGFSASEVQKKLVDMGHTVGDQVLSLQTTRFLISLMDDEKAGKLSVNKFQELQSYVSAAKSEFLDYCGVNSSGVSKDQMKMALASRDLRLNDLNFRLLWDRYSTAGVIGYDDFVIILARLESLKDRFRSHRMTNLPCDCMMASFSLDDFIRDTLL